MNNQTKWTEADFDQMSWHDCHIYSIAFDEVGEWQIDLVLKMDFIVEWLCGTDKTCRFRIAPAVLRFREIDKLNIHISLQSLVPLEIYSVERTDISLHGHQRFHWTIKVQCYPEQKMNYIEFDATGFTQELLGGVIESSSQHLTTEQRKLLQD